jgi:hypothetical protein
MLADQKSVALRSCEYVCAAKGASSENLLVNGSFALGAGEVGDFHSRFSDLDWRGYQPRTGTLYGREDIADSLGLTVETREADLCKTQVAISLPHTQTIVVHHIGRLIAIAAGPDRDGDETIADLVSENLHCALVQ